MINLLEVSQEIIPRAKSSGNTHCDEGKSVGSFMKLNSVALEMVTISNEALYIIAFYYGTDAVSVCARVRV